MAKGKSGLVSIIIEKKEPLFDAALIRGLLSQNFGNYRNKLSITDCATYNKNRK
jgi:hypothetical protein